MAKESRPDERLEISFTPTGQCRFVDDRAPILAVPVFYVVIEVVPMKHTLSAFQVDGIGVSRDRLTWAWPSSVSEVSVA